MVTLENWRKQMSEDMRLRDFRPRTQEGYLLAVRQFIEHVGGAPKTFTEEHVRLYFLHLRDTKKRAPSTINLAVHALRFFFTFTMPRTWTVFNLLRVNRPQMLPVVLSLLEVRRVLSVIRHPVYRIALMAIYALGLRISEGLALETKDIDSERLIVWVRDGKGGKDRGVPLPRPLLSRLRQYWRAERPKSTSSFLFVADPKAVGPLHETSLQKSLRAACAEVGLEKHATVHTLRHSYATHLLEAGISLRTIQQLLGHKSLKTTEVYVHVTQASVERVQDIVDRLMADL